MKKRKRLLAAILTGILVVNYGTVLWAATAVEDVVLLLNETQIEEEKETFILSDTNTYMVSVEELADMIQAEIWKKGDRFFFSWNKMGVLFRENDQKVFKVKNESWKEWDEFQISEPIIKNNERYYIPLEDICEILGIDMQWFETERAIKLYFKSGIPQQYMNAEVIQNICITYDVLNGDGSRYDINTKDFQEFYEQREGWRDTAAMAVSNLWGGLNDLISQNTNAENILMDCMDNIMKSVTEEGIVTIDIKIFDEIKNYVVNGNSLSNELMGIDSKFLSKIPEMNFLNDAINTLGDVYDFTSFSIEQLAFLMSNYKKQVDYLQIIKKNLKESGELTELIEKSIDKLIREYSCGYAHLFSESAIKATQLAVSKILDGATATGEVWGMAEFAWEKVFKWTGASENGSALKSFYGFYILDGAVNRAYKAEYKKILNGNYKKEDVYELELLEDLQRSLKKLTYESIRKITNDKETQKYCKKMEKIFSEDTSKWNQWIKNPKLQEEREICRTVSQITNLPYIGDRRVETPMILEQDRRFLKPMEEEGILGCLKMDFDNDQKEEILAVTYENRENTKETGKNVRVTMYEQQENTWIVSDMFELIRYDYQGMLDEMSTMSASAYTGFEGNLFLRKTNGEYQFFYECNRFSKYLATGFEWYFIGYTYDGSRFREMNQTTNLYYGGSGLETDCLFSLDPTPLYGDSYGQDVIDIIEDYQSLGFQSEQIGSDGYSIHSTVSQDPYCYSLVRLIRGDRLNADVVNEWWANPVGNLEGFWIDLEDYTAQIGEIQECIISELEPLDFPNASEENPYADFLNTNGVGAYYSILPAGENQEAILIISDSFPEQDADTFVPDLGYGITIYGNDNGNVYQIGDYIHISEATGPWRFYANKLMGAGRRGGYFTVDITETSYEMNFHPDDGIIYENWEALTLFKNRGGWRSPVI